MRIKRKASTLFMLVEPSDNFAGLKTLCGDVMGVPSSSVQLIHTDKVRCSRLYCYISYSPKLMARLSPKHRILS